MSRKIKVMQIMPEFGLAGAEIMAEHLSNALNDEEFDVKLVSLYNYHSAITERLEKKNITIFYLSKTKGFDCKIFFKLYKLFRNEKPDIVHTHRYLMVYAMLPALFVKVPVKIHTIHSIAQCETKRIYRKLNSFFYHYLNVIPVSLSFSIQKTILKEYNLPEYKVPVIHNGINFENIIPKKASSYHATKKIRIIHIGRFSRVKNHLGLIEAYRIVNNKYPNTELQLIGEGNLKNTLKNEVKTLGLEKNVQFVGLQNNVYTYLNESDIFVISSLWEGTPMTLLEAMATGLPIVATSVGGIPDIIQNRKTGLLVEVESHKIAQALIELIEDDELRKKIGEASRSYVKKFSVENMKEGYINLYKSQLHFEIS